jgi:hypothetical protein
MRLLAAFLQSRRKAFAGVQQYVSRRLSVPFTVLCRLTIVDMSVKFINHIFVLSIDRQHFCNMHYLGFCLAGEARH